LNINYPRNRSIWTIDPRPSISLSDLQSSSGNSIMVQGFISINMQRAIYRRFHLQLQLSLDHQTKKTLKFVVARKAIANDRITLCKRKYIYVFLNLFNHSYLNEGVSLNIGCRPLMRHNSSDIKSNDGKQANRNYPRYSNAYPVLI
jgi:hypothetical protein